MGAAESLEVVLGVGAAEGPGVNVVNGQVLGGVTPEALVSVALEHEGPHRIRDRRPLRGKPDGHGLLVGHQDAIAAHAARTKVNGELAESHEFA